MKTTMTTARDLKFWIPVIKYTTGMISKPQKTTHSITHAHPLRVNKMNEKDLVFFANSTTIIIIIYLCFFRSFVLEFVISILCGKKNNNKVNFIKAGFDDRWCRYRNNILAAGIIIISLSSFFTKQTTLTTTVCCNKLASLLSIFGWIGFFLDPRWWFVFVVSNIDGGGGGGSKKLLFKHQHTTLRIFFDSTPKKIKIKTEQKKCHPYNRDIQAKNQNQSVSQSMIVSRSCLLVDFFLNKNFHCDFFTGSIFFQPVLFFFIVSK